MTSKDLKLIAAVACTLAIVPAVSGCHQADPPPAAPPPAAANTPQNQAMASMHSQEAQFEAQQRAKALKAAGQ